jgi:hypothetical protein
MEIKHMEVAKQSLELADTGLESLEYIKQQYKEGKFTETFYLFNDVVNAFSTMERSIQGLLPHLPENQISLLMDRLRNGLGLIVSTYEQDRSSQAREVLQFNLMPTYKEWRIELHRVLDQYVS